MKLITRLRAVMKGDLVPAPPRTWAMVFCDECGRPQFHWRGWPDGLGHVTPCTACGSRNASVVKVGELERLRPVACQTDQEARERAAR